MAEGNSQYAVNIAKELSSRLVASEARVAELEGRLAALEVEVQVYRDRSEQAERWLNKISSELQTRIVGKAELNSSIPGTSPLGGPIEKVGLFALFVPDKQPRMPAAADPPTAVADLPHLLWIAVPMPPETSRRMPSGIESGSTFVLTSRLTLPPLETITQNRPRFRRATLDRRGLIELRLPKRWPPRELPCPVPHRAGDNERPQLGATREISHPGFVRRGTVNREVSMIRLAVAGPP